MALLVCSIPASFNCLHHATIPALVAPLCSAATMLTLLRGCTCVLVATHAPALVPLPCMWCMQVSNHLIGDTVIVQDMHQRKARQLHFSAALRPQCSTRVQRRHHC